jgi:2'-hydroxyisoflavone reductase
MRLLVLGGTTFLGKHCVEGALSRDHTVTLFNRGRSHPERFPECERITGDRDGGLDALAGREWDAVLDTSGYVPRIVGDSARLLAGSAGSYLFVSSVSVYDGQDRARIDESTPVATIADEGVEEITEETYGPLKALCEQAVRDAMPGGAIIVRPGLIVGPDDPTDRFTYWPVRLAAGGDVLAPEPRDQPCQVIDVRDLAAWMLDLIEHGEPGTLNGVGPEQPRTLAETVEICAAAVGGAARLEWVDGSFLVEQGVEPWTELPLWTGDDPGEAWIDRIDPGPGVAAGLRFRPLEQTADDTLRWHIDAGREPAFAMTREREAGLLAAWRQR